MAFFFVLHRFLFSLATSMVESSQLSWTATFAEFLLLKLFYILHVI